jgi:hypothetical protein
MWNDDTKVRGSVCMNNVGCWLMCEIRWLSRTPSLLLLLLLFSSLDRSRCIVPSAAELDLGLVCEMRLLLAGCRRIYLS